MAEAVAGDLASVRSILTPGTDAASIYRAMLESIAFGCAAVDERRSEVLVATSFSRFSGSCIPQVCTLWQQRVRVIAEHRRTLVSRSLTSGRRSAV